MVRIYLTLAALAWLPYGLYLLFLPEELLAIAGIAATDGAATTELRAMYGGLQVGIGVLCVAALLRERFAVPVLGMSAVLTGGLFSGRLIGIFTDAGALDAYNMAALAFEAVACAGAAWLATRSVDAID